MPRLRILRSSCAWARVCLMLAFGGLAALALGLQHLLLDRGLWRADGRLLNLAMGSFVVLMPIPFLVGIAATRRLLGPLGRLERLPEATLRGEPTADLRRRWDEDLHEIVWMARALTAARRREPQPGARPHQEVETTEEAA